jgi:hypothetical protein
VHLLVDISAHGLGHLAQTAPVLNALRPLLPGLRLSLRSALPLARLRARIEGEFEHIAEARDFGFLMHNAVDIDRAASAQRYREFHADWSQRVATRRTNCAADGSMRCSAMPPTCRWPPRPRPGIPAVGMSSLNWADMFAHYLGGEAWAAPIHAQILDAYNAAVLSALRAGLADARFPRRIALGPVAGSRAERSRIFLSPAGLDDRVGAGFWWPWAAWISPWTRALAGPMTDVCWLLPGSPDRIFPRRPARLRPGRSRALPTCSPASMP